MNTKIFEVGDNVWETRWGHGIVIGIDKNPNEQYPVAIQFKMHDLDEPKSFTWDGRYYPNENRSLFFEEIQIPETALTKKRMPKLEVDQKVLVFDKRIGEWVKRHFHSFGDDGRIRTFIEGRTSWTVNPKDDYFSVTEWNEWKLAGDEL
jgi:hypothetical protein